MTLEAVYTPWVTLLPSTQKQEQRPLVLAEGQFTQDAVLHVQSSGLTPPSGVKEGRYTLWEIALSGTPGSAERPASDFRFERAGTALAV